MTKEESAKLLDKAAQICVSKHAGQRDKMGCAYFLHPMRVAMRCRTDEEKMVALGNPYLPKRTKLLHPTSQLLPSVGQQDKEFFLGGCYELTI